MNPVCAIDTSDMVRGKKMFAFKCCIQPLIAFSILIFVSSGAVGRMADADEALLMADADEALLRDHLINFLQSGSTLNDIEPSHAMYPLSKMPLLATTAYLLMEDDPGTLSRFYPDISRIVLNRFEQQSMTAAGIVRGSPTPAPAEKIALSPTVNALAALELYSLHMMAHLLGKHEDAIELIAETRKLSGAITATFYNPSRNYFFPLGTDGKFIISYAPEQLLPLLFEQNLGEETHRRILRTLLYWYRTYRKSGRMPYVKESMLSDPLLRPVLIDLLYSIPWFSGELLEALNYLLIDGSDHLQTPPAFCRHWVTFWSERPMSRRDLFPSWRMISRVKSLTSILERESLLAEDTMKEMRADADSLAETLSRNSIDLDSYSRTLLAANRLLVNISNLGSSITTGAEPWDALDQSKWKRISPRTRRLVSVGCSLVPDEITRAKIVLSNLLSAGTGLVTKVHLPKHPVPLGKPVPIKVSVTSVVDTFRISRVYLQVGGTRKKLTNSGEEITVQPGLSSKIYDGSLPLPPALRTGLWPVHIYLDFMIGGKRIEIHTLESISLTKAYDISINYPMGHKLAGAQLPINIVLKIKLEHDTRGTVDGSFFEELSCHPKLPASFLVHAGTQSTTLPLTVTPLEKIPPGPYPFNLTVNLDDKTIGSFEGMLVQPIRWFFLGPLAVSSFKSGSILPYQDNFHETYTSTEGRSIKWQEVPTGAIDESGAVLPDRLLGAQANDCYLLYTVIKADKRLTVSWKCTTSNKTALWTNSELVLSAETAEGDAYTGVIELRKGLNSFLFASCRQSAQDRFLFGLSDQHGLPVDGITNEIDGIIEQATGRAADSDEMEASPDRLREVSLIIDHPDARTASVVGSFNNWDPDETLMQKNENGIWAVTLVLSPGRYSYKFLIDGSIKITDPRSELVEPDGFGGLNSILVID